MTSLAGAKARVAITGFLSLAELTPLSVQEEQDDVQCLRGTKEELADPGGGLSSWNFTAVTTTNASAICNFDGAACWNENDSRVLSLQLEEPRTERPDPRVASALQKPTIAEPCRQQHFGDNPAPNMQLDSIFGQPQALRQRHQRLPAERARQLHLSILELSDNKLSGTIPPELAKLERLKTFSVAGNDLNGEIPPSFAGFNAAAFSGNRGLCGAPLGPCGGGKRKMVVIVGAGVSGAIASLAVSFGLLRWCERRNTHPTRGGTGDSRGIQGVAQR